MSAKKIKKTATKSVSQKPTFLSGFSIDKYIPEKYQILFYLVVILLLFLFFFSPLYFGGMTFQSGDIVTSKSVVTYLEKERDGFTLWNPYVFGGMPAYAIAVGYKWFNLIWVGLDALRKVFSSPFAVDYAKWTFYLLGLAYTMFAFFYYRTRNKLVSFIVANAVAFCTGIVVFLYIGHVTKLAALWVYPVLFLLLFNYQKRIKFVEIIILIITLDLLFLGWHVQIIFYTFFAVMIYFIYFFLRSLKLKDKLLTTQLIKSAVVFIAAIVVALLIQSDNFTQIYEYSPYSTRGTESVLEKETAVTEQSESDFYQYATNWSFSPGEVLTFIIPSYYGFGKSTYQGPLTQNKPVEVNTYFGQMPFVDVAMYMGVIIFFLALFSMIINWRDPVVRFLTILSVIALLISFGRTFPPLYDLMFHYFPFFDKFRVPSMILVLVQLSFPLLAGLGLVKILSLKKESDLKVERLVRNAAILFGGLFFVSLVLASPIKDWFVGRIVESGEKGTRLQPLHDYMSGMFLTDARLAFFFTAAVFGMAFAFIKGKLSGDLFAIAVAVLILIDLFRINHRGETFTDNVQQEMLFSKPDYIQAIEDTGDRSLYRILNLKQDGSIGSLNQNSNFLTSFLQYDIYGYSGIKPRAIQDYYDVLGSPANITFWRMLNVKYIVFDKAINQPGLLSVYNGANSFLYINQNVLPRAYFVNRIEKKPALEIINMVKNNQFDPLDIAFTEKEIPNIDQPDSTAFVNMISFEDERIEIDLNASGNNFLFLGDTYFPKGWSASIDGTETEIYKANHGFRGIVVPKGEHKVVFTYLPESFVISKYVALLLSTLTILGLIIGLIFRRKQKNLATTG
ncbi:MAG: hypothetical protein DRQ13_01215 [Ignavibacteriae bacterium]|nr:MAG: hypothetical protein DRQ13_01215 [Ignavibacteriota bacterium]